MNLAIFNVWPGPDGSRRVGRCRPGRFAGSWGRRCSHRVVADDRPPPASNRLKGTPMTNPVAEKSVVMEPAAPIIVVEPVPAGKSGGILTFKTGQVRMSFAGHEWIPAVDENRV